MNSSEMNPNVEFFFNKAEKWQEELYKLRLILLDSGLTEELKWGVPVYTYRKKNIAGINGLKESCALAFFKGALLEDFNNILVKPGRNTQAGRWVKFTSVREITELEPVLNAYIFEAIEVEKAGLNVNMKTTSEYTIPEELQHKFKEIPAIKTAFEALTPGRQHAYMLYFSAPKQSKIREARVERYIPQILSGKGLYD